MAVSEAVGSSFLSNPVVAFFIRVGTFLAKSKVAAAVFTAFQILTVAVGIKNFMTAQDLLRKGQDILATKVAAGGKVSIIYGTRRVGSQLIFLDTADNRSKDLFCVYALSVGPVDHIDLTTIELNGVPITDTKVFRDGYYLGSDKISSGAGSLNTTNQVGNINQTSSGISGTDPTKRYRFVANAHHGATSQTVDPMLNASIGTKWTTAHKLNGIAYIAFSAEFDSKAMFKGLPQLTVVVRGKKVFDPRDSSQTFGTPSTYTYSSNPALCFLDYISNAEYGKGLGSNQLNFTSFETAATACDTLVNTPDFNGSSTAITFSGIAGTNLMTTTESIWKKIRAGDKLFLTDGNSGTIFDGIQIDSTSRDQYFGDAQINKIFTNANLGSTFTDETGTVLIKTNRFQCHGVIDANKTVMENSQALLGSMRGIFNYVNGQYELAIEDTGSSTFSVNDNHIISEGGISINYGNKDNRYNKVVVNYFNSQKGYEADTVTVLHEATTDSNDFTSDDGGEELEIKIDCEFVSSPYVAFNMGKGVLARSRYQTQITFQATPELYKCNVGDIIDITYAPLDLNATLYRIETIDLLPNGLLSVTAIIYFDVYTYTLPAAANVAPKANIPSAFALVTPTGLSFVDTTASSTNRPYITWTENTDFPTNEYRVIIKSGSVAVYNNIVTSNYAFLDFLPTGSYTAEVTAINSVKAESDAGTLSFSITNLPVRSEDIQSNAITIAKLSSDVTSAISAGGTNASQLQRATSAPTTRADNTALQPQDIWIDTDDDNQLYIRNSANNAWEKARDATLVTLYNSLNTTVGSQGTTLATAVQDIVTVTTAEAATATALTALTVVAGSNTAGVTTNSSAVATINGNASAAYSLKVNANGAVAQMVLSSNASTGSGATSTIAFLADTFAIDNGSGTGILPFTVTGGTVFIDNARITNLSADKIQIDGVTLDTSGGQLIIKTDGISTTQIGTRAVGSQKSASASGTSNFPDGRSGDNFGNIHTFSFTTADAGVYMIQESCMVGGDFHSLTQLESRIRVGSTVVADYLSPIGSAAIQPIIQQGTISLAAATTYTVDFQGQVKQDNPAGGEPVDIGGFSSALNIIKLSKQ